jgi:hypothetical protein
MRDEVLEQLERRLGDMHNNGAISKLGVRQVRSVVKTELTRNRNVNEKAVDRMYNEITKRTGISQRSEQPIRELLDDMFLGGNHASETTMLATSDDRHYEDRVLSDAVDEVNREIAEVLAEAVDPIQSKFHEMLAEFRHESRIVNAKRDVIEDLARFLNKHQPRNDERSWLDELRIA